MRHSNCRPVKGPGGSSDLIMSSMWRESVLSSQQLKRHDSQGPRIHRPVHDHRFLSSAESIHDFRRRIRKAECQACTFPDLASAPKVNHCPPVLARQPHHVRRLHVPVCKAGFMQGLEPQGNVINDLNSSAAVQQRTAENSSGAQRSSGMSKHSVNHRGCSTGSWLWSAMSQSLR
jgi:hypothetical protein